MSADTIVSGSILGQAEALLAASNEPEDNSSLDSTDFLTLLVAQLEYQDPLNPVENTDFASQMAQFASLETLTNINDNIETLIDSTAGSQMSTAVSFIGKDVRADGYTLSVKDDKISTVYYSLGETVYNAFLNIYDEDGELVRTVEIGTRDKGEYEYEWDGKDWAGKEVPDGTYSVAIKAYNANDKQVLVQTEVSGEVAGVIFENGNYYLRLDDGRFVNFLNVNEVVSPNDAASKDGDGTDGDGTDGDGTDETDDATEETADDSSDDA